MFKSNAPLLLIDAGNTRLKFGLATILADGGSLPEIRSFTAIRDLEPLPWQDVRSWLIKSTQPPQGILTGSNPEQIDRVVREWPVEWPAPCVMVDRQELPIEIDVDFPDRVGMDRLLNAVAVNVVRKSKQPAVVIDVGTATTVDAVSRIGAFIGGAIIAGPELTSRALHEYTAVLPHVSLDELAAREPVIIGRNTEDAIKSGLYWGHWQAVWSYCVRMMEPLGVAHAPQTIITGGAAGLFLNRFSPAHQFLPHLTLQGLAVAASSTRQNVNRGSGG